MSFLISFCILLIMTLIKGGDGNPSAIGIEKYHFLALYGNKPFWFDGSRCSRTYWLVWIMENILLLGEYSQIALSDLCHFALIR